MAAKELELSDVSLSEELRRLGSDIPHDDDHYTFLALIVLAVAYGFGANTPASFLPIAVAVFGAAFAARRVRERRQAEAFAEHLMAPAERTHERLLQAESPTEKERRVRRLELNELRREIDATDNTKSARKQDLTTALVGLFLALAAFTISLPKWGLAALGITVAYDLISRYRIKRGRAAIEAQKDLINREIARLDVQELNRPESPPSER